MIAVDIIGLALHELWCHRTRSLLALLALTLASGLIAATGSIGALLRATAESPAPLAGRPADLWIASAYDADYDLPASVASRVAAVPGVAAAQPVLRRPAQVRTPGGAVDDLALVGVDLPLYLAFHEMEVAAGHLPTSQQPGLVALSPWAFARQVHPGDLVTVTVAGTGVPLPVTGLVEVRDLGSAQQGPVVYAPREMMATLAGVDGVVTLVEVRLAPGASPRRLRSALEAELGAGYVVSAPVQPDTGLWHRLVIGALLFVDVLVLLGSAALVYATFVAAGPDRVRRVAVMRAVGATHAHVVVVLASEALVLGFAGGVLGLILGFLMAANGSEWVMAGAALAAAPSLPCGSAVLAVTLSMSASLGGALAPSLHAVRIPPAQALRPDARSYAATGCTGCSRLARLGHRLPGALPLAADNLACDPRRTILVAGSLALVLTMFLGSVGILSLLDEELAVALGRLSGGDYLLLPDVAALSLGELSGQDTSRLPPLSPALLAALEALDDRIWVMRGTTADIKQLQVFPGQPTVLVDIEGYARMGAFDFLQGSWPEALDAFRRGPAVLLVPVVARRLNASPGDTVRLDTARGPVEFAVAGVGDSEFTTCVLSLADGAAYLGANEVNAAMVKGKPGVELDELRSALLAAVRTYGGTFLSLHEAGRRLHDAFRQARVATGLLVTLTGLVALLGVVSATLSSVTERRAEIGVLRAVGAARYDVVWLMLVETGILGVAAAGAGTVLGWVVTGIFVWFGGAQLGLGNAVAEPEAWVPLLVATAAAWLLWPGLTMLSALAAAWAAARVPILDALFDAP